LEFPLDIDMTIGVRSSRLETGRVLVEIDEAEGSERGVRALLALSGEWQPNLKSEEVGHAPISPAYRPPMRSASIKPCLPLES
jgi:hypothetical protein